MVGQTNNRFREHFSLTDRPMLLDGATGTELMKRGLQPGECGELWNLSNPSLVKEIHKLYYDAGSDAVLTNTFGAVATRLKRKGLEKSVYDIKKIS